MNKTKPIVLSMIVLSVVLVSGCASMNQSMKMAPLGTNYPVSASSSLFVGGKTISGEGLHSAKDFEFMKYYSPKMTEREVQLDLADDLTRIIEQNGANAIIKLRVSVENIDTGAIGWISFERSGGVLIVLGGGALVGFGAIGGPAAQGIETAGIITSIAGAAIFAGSWLHQSLATVGYSVKIDGTTVRY